MTSDNEKGTPVNKDERVRASIDNWKRKLLDLTKRNRALNFKVNKVSTITVVDELPAEVFRQLYLRETSMRFKAAPEPEKDNSSSLIVHRDLPNADGELFEAEPLAFEEADEDEGLHQDFVPYDAASLEERHADDQLQTTSQVEALDKSLRRLDEQARLSLEEQGVNPLFLAIGMLHYKESVDSDQIFKAPLILLPVELTRKSARSGYQICHTDEDPLVNPALAEYLRSHSITLPELPDPSHIPDDYDLQTFLSTVTERIEDKKGWAVKTDIYLGLFSFQKFVMYKDLEANGEPFASHRIIRNLVLSSGGHIVGLPDDIRAMQLDKEYPPESTFQVVDADSSQLRTIAAC